MNVLHNTLMKLHKRVAEEISKGEVDVKAIATIDFDVPYGDGGGEVEKVPFEAILTLHIRPKEE